MLITNRRENPCRPKFVLEDDLNTYTRIQPPEEYLRLMDREPTNGQQKSLALIVELLEDELFITDKQRHIEKIRELADREGTTVKRIQKLYFRHIAGRSLAEERKTLKKPETAEHRDFNWAIDTLAKKMSLRSAYDMMLLSRYTDPNGYLKKEYPSWHSFRHYFYGNNFHKKSKALISRSGYLPCVKTG